MPIPTVLWADRKDKVYVTLDIQDVYDHNIKLDNQEQEQIGKLSFTGKGGAEKQDYSLDLNLLKTIDVSSSKVSVTPRSIFIVIAKKDPEVWPRLTKEPAKQHAHIKVDWDKWIDEDEEDKVDLSQFNFSGFGDMDDDQYGQQAEEEQDSDNEDLPDLVQ